MKMPGICPHCKRALAITVDLGPAAQVQAHGPVVGEPERAPSRPQAAVPVPVCPECAHPARLVCKNSKARGPFRFLACTNTSCTMATREPPWIPGTFRWLNGEKAVAQAV